MAQLCGYKQTISYTSPLACSFQGQCQTYASLNRHAFPLRITFFSLEYNRSLFTLAYAKHCLFIVIVKQELRPFPQLLVSYGLGKTNNMASVVIDRIIAAKEDVTYRHTVSHRQLEIHIR